MRKRRGTTRGRKRGARRKPGKNRRVGRRAWTTRHAAVVASAVVLVAGMGYAISRASMWGRREEPFVLSEVEVVGNEVLTEGEVVALSGLEVGSNLLSVSISDVEESVASSPRVERAQALRLLPDRIVVRLDETPPAAFVVAAAGECIEVTDAGLVLPTAERSTLIDLPLITGAVGEMAPAGGGTAEDGTAIEGATDAPGMRATEEVLEVLELLRVAREISPLLWMEISEVRIAPGSGLVIYTVADGAEIRVGSGALNSQGLNRLWMVLRDVRERGEAVQSIDLRYRDQAVVRLRPGSGRRALAGGTT